MLGVTLVPIPFHCQWVRRPDITPILIVNLIGGDMNRTFGKNRNLACSCSLIWVVGCTIGIVISVPNPFLLASRRRYDRRIGLGELSVLRRPARVSSRCSGASSIRVARVPPDSKSGGQFFHWQFRRKGMPDHRNLVGI